MLNQTKAFVIFFFIVAIPHLKLLDLLTQNCHAPPFGTSFVLGAPG